MTGIAQYEMLFLEEERGNHVTIFTNPAIADVRSTNKLANSPVPNTGMTARTYRKFSLSSILLDTNLVEVVPHH